MTQVKVFKKGEYLYKEGEKAGTVYLIQSGSVSLHLTRQKQTIDICRLGNLQIAGEHILSGTAIHPHSAQCMTETKVIELPAEVVKTQVDAGSQIVKFLHKGTSEKLKVVMKELHSSRLEKDNTPCPADQTAKIFGTLFHVAKTKGESKSPGMITVSFPMMKQYAQRVFLESPKRLEMAMNIFVKLGFATYEIGIDEEDPDAVEEIKFVHLNELDLIEQFFEFYQYYYFKGGKMELLKTDERAMFMVGSLIEQAPKDQLDRNGFARVEFSKLADQVKEFLGLQLNADHFTLLETKGLLVKRASDDKGVWLQFDYREFERTHKIWKVLREVERWNVKGSVDPNEPVVETTKVAKKATTAACECPQCKATYEVAPKFCAECGFKFAAAA